MFECQARNANQCGWRSPIEDGMARGMGGERVRSWLTAGGIVGTMIWCCVLCARARGRDVGIGGGGGCAGGDGGVCVGGLSGGPETSPL